MGIQQGWLVFSPGERVSVELQGGEHSNPVRKPRLRDIKHFAQSHVGTESRWGFKQFC